MRSIDIKRIFASGFVLTLLTACTIQDGARTGLRAVAERDGLIEFTAAPFDQASERIIYADTSERDEYALYSTPDRQAEIVYITTRHLHLTNLVIDRLFDLDRAMFDFRHNQYETAVSGEAFKFAAHDIRYWARAYQLPQAGKTCGAFSGSWDSPPDDLRPSKALFGYFCEQGTVPMTPEKIQKTVAQVGIRGITAHAIDGATAYPVLTEEPSQTALLRRAQGQLDGATGNTEFPYKIVRFFKRENSCRFLPGC